jgi:hypothetical protein
MAIVWRLAPWSLVVTLACTPSSRSPEASGAPPVSRATSEPSQSYPVVRVDRADNYADERASSDFEIRPDGAFTIVHVNSTGGSESTVTECVGRLPAAEAAAWVARVRSDATLATPPPGVRREEAFERNIPYRYTVGYAAGAGSIAYVDPDRWTRELEPFLERLSKLARCTRSTRRD